MGLELRLAITGDLRKTLTALAQAEANGVHTVIRRRTTQLKTALRKQVVRAGLGERLANAIRSEVMPPRGPAPHVDTRGRVFSKALAKRPGGLVDLITVFDQGATIRAFGHELLALPLPAAGRRGRRGARSTPADFPKGELVVIKSSNGTLLLIDRETKTPMFLLVRRVHVRKRLTVQAAYAKAMQGLDEAVAKEIERRMAKLGFGVAA